MVRFDALNGSGAGLRLILSRFSWAFLGLAVIRVWIQCLKYDRYTLTDAALTIVTINFVQVAFALVLVCLVVVFGFPHRARRILLWISTVFMTLSGILFLLEADGLATSKLLACALGGIGIVWGAGAWMELYLRFEPGEALFYTLASLAFGSLIILILGFLPAYAGIMISIIAPVLSLTMLTHSHRLLDRRDEKVPEQKPVYDSEPRSTWILLCTGLALFEFALGVARGFPNGSSFYLAPAFQVIHQVGAASLCIAGIYIAVVRALPVRYSTIWRFEILLIVLGILLISSLDWLGMSAGATLITTANSLMLAALWYTAYDIGRRISINPFLPLGIIWAVFPLSREAGRWFVLTFPPDAGFVTAFEILMILLVCGSIVLVFNSAIPKTRELFADLSISPTSTVRNLSNAQTETEPESDAEREDEIDVGATLMRLYRLTSREAEVVALLLEGKSKVEVGRTLFISENTVRGHVKNAYAKMDVHSKTELWEKCRTIGMH